MKIRCTSQTIRLADRFLDLGQKEVEPDPLGVVERVYEFAGLSLDADLRRTMAGWAAENQRGARGGHDYSPEEFGLSNSTIRRAYKAYLDEFGDYC